MCMKNCMTFTLTIFQIQSFARDPFLTSEWTKESGDLGPPFDISLIFFSPSMYYFVRLKVIKVY